MSLIVKIASGVVAVLAALYLLGFVLPDQTHVHREITIEADRERVFALVSDFSNWPAWSPWADIDPATEVTVTGAGVGHQMVWRSANREVGSGTQRIVTYEPPRMVEAELRFDGMGRATTAFVLTEAGEGTRIVWSFDARSRDGVPLLAQPIHTYMGFFMDSFIGPSYERGLTRLKDAAEA